MGPSPEKETSGETTSWRLCLARSLGAVRGTGGTARRLRVSVAHTAHPALGHRGRLCALGIKENSGSQVGPGDPPGLGGDQVQQMIKVVRA